MDWCERGRSRSYHRKDPSTESCRYQSSNEKDGRSRSGSNGKLFKSPHSKDILKWQKWDLSQNFIDTF